MSGHDKVSDVMQLAMERRSFQFFDYEPRGEPGFESNIAEVFGCSSNQTNNLLDAVDIIDHVDHYNHYDVSREPVAPATAGSKGKRYPQRIRVIVSLA